MITETIEYLRTATSQWATGECQPPPLLPVSVSLNSDLYRF